MQISQEQLQLTDNYSKQKVDRIKSIERTFFPRLSLFIWKNDVTISVK